MHNTLETLVVAIGASVVALSLLCYIAYRCLYPSPTGDGDMSLHLLADGGRIPADPDAESVRYTVQRKLGDGTYGTVYLAKRKEDGSLVAVKVVSCNTEKQARDAMNEYKACALLQGHPNVVRLIEMFEDAPLPSTKAASLYGPLGYSATILAKLRIAVSKSSNVFVCTVHEYYPHGTLFDLLVRKRCGLPEAQVWDYTKQLLSSMVFIHSNNIVHRDVKPSNILVSSDETLLAVTDFGLARATAADELAKTKIGTYHYMSPEQIDKRGYNAKADVWAVGCVVYAMCTAKVSTRDAVVMFMARKAVDFPEKTEKDLKALGYSIPLASFILSLLEEDPALRPAADEALQRLKLLIEKPLPAAARSAPS